jgi:hypothetical protein
MTRPVVVPPAIVLSLFLAWIALLAGAFLLGLRLA